MSPSSGLWWCRRPGIVRWFVALAAACWALGFSNTADAALRVVTTTPDLAAITRAVGAGRVEVTALATATQDPHFVDARPHLALALHQADLLVEIGADLEVGWFPTLLVGSRNGDIQRGARGALDASTLADWLGLVVVEHLEPKPGIPPSPRHVANVVAVGKAKQVTLLVQEAWYPTGTSSVAAASTGARLVVIPGMTDFAQGQSYVAYLGAL